MAHSFNYAILQVVPDARRGERVNIGLVVFKNDGLDVRVSESRKLTALTARSWDADIKAFGEIVHELDDPQQDAGERHSRLLMVQDQLTVSDAGWFDARTSQAYEKAVRDIMKTLVARPRRTKHSDGPSVVSEISATLRTKNLLAKKGDTLDSGLVFKNYHVDDGLDADFAQKNSRFHVATVLDLSANNPQLAQAALKAVVLDRAEKKIGRESIHKMGIFFAAKERIAELRDNLAILKPYADDLLNWGDPHDRQEVQRVFAQAHTAHQQEELLE